jgi:hypothetical protein
MESDRAVLSWDRMLLLMFVASIITDSGKPAALPAIAGRPYHASAGHGTVEKARG